METEDQAQTSTGQEGAETKDTEATPTDQDQKQSSGDQTAQQPKTYRIGGRELTSDELYEKHSALERDYTQKSQRLAELERTSEVGAGADQASKKIVEAQNVAPEIREAVLGIVRPEMEKEFDRRLKARDQQAYWDSSFDKLSQTWDGKGGKPRFTDTDRQTITDEMRSPYNLIYDPTVLYERRHSAEIDDWKVKQALRKQKGTTPTEKTGAPTSERKPAKKGSPKSVGEASDRFYKRLGQAGYK